MMKEQDGCTGMAAVAFPEEMAEIWGTDDTGEGGIAV